MNVSYCRVKDLDFDNRSFVVDCYTFTLLNPNPFYLERKFENVFEREYVEMVWNTLIPNNFYSFVCQIDYYNVLNSTKLKFQDAAEIVKSFVDNANNFQQLQQFLKKNVRLFQYAYTNLFPKYFS